MSRVKKILEGIVKSDRVGGAYLFVGPPGAGKKEAAEDFAGLLRCARQDKIIIAPGGASLKIEQVRELQGWVRYGPSAGRYLVAIVEGADTLTDQAAAAFLKTLEEPAPGVVFVLLAERADRLSQTVLSRCQKVIFSEKAKERRSGKDFEGFQEELRSIKKKNCGQIFELSARMEKEKERVEDLLLGFAHYVFYELRDTRSARIILDSLRCVKRRANLKLTLDVMCLRLAPDRAGKNNG